MVEESLLYSVNSIIILIWSVIILIRDTRLHSLQEIVHVHNTCQSIPHLFFPGRSSDISHAIRVSKMCSPKKSVQQTAGIAYSMQQALHTLLAKLVYLTYVKLIRF